MLPILVLMLMASVYMFASVKLDSPGQPVLKKLTSQFIERRSLKTSVGDDVYVPLDEDAADADASLAAFHGADVPPVVPAPDKSGIFYGTLPTTPRTGPGILSKCSFQAISKR